MKRKNIVSLTIAFAFLYLSATGILMYFDLKPAPVTTVHVLIGLLFVGFAIVHIINNWNSLKLYSKERKEKKLAKEFWLAFALAGILLVSAGFGLPPFPQIQHFGEDLVRGLRKEGTQEHISFVKIASNNQITGTRLQLIIEKDEAVITPVMAIWTADSSGKFLDNIFVPAKILEVNPDENDKREALSEGETELKNFTRGTLKIWQSATTDSVSNFPGATPTDNFFLSTKTKATGKFQLMLEVKNNEQTEIYRADIDPDRASAFVLKSAGHSLLKNAIVQLQ